MLILCTYNGFPSQNNIAQANCGLWSNIIGNQNNKIVDEVEEFTPVMKTHGCYWHIPSKYQIFTESFWFLGALNNIITNAKNQIHNTWT